MVRTLMSLLLFGLFSASMAPAASLYWTGASGSDLLWATPGNWTPSGPPAAADTAIFGIAGTVSDQLTVNNVVGTSTQVTGLSYTNSTAGTWHVTQIPSGATLTATGPFIVGGGPGGGLTTSAAICDGGTFVVTGTAMTIGNGSTSAGSKSPGTLDMSALSNFVYSSTGGTIGLGTTGSRSEGNLTLAAVTNSITAGTININGATGTGSTPMFNLGAGTNVLNVGTFNVGGGRSTTTLQFVSSSDATAGLRLRGTGGTDSDRCTMTLGNRNTGGTSTLTTTGNAFLNGHPVDVKLGTLTLGLMSRSGTEANFIAVGNLQFDQGTVDATTINMGVCSGTSPTSAARGTLTVGAGGTLTVGNVSLANVTQAGSSATGTLNISGGGAICTGNILKTSTALSTGVVAVASGTLSISGSLGSASNPIDNLDLSGATLTIRSAASAPAVVTTLTTGGTTNVINISSIPSITAYPAQFQVIKYAGTIGGVGFDNNIGLGSVPVASPAFEGYLSNNLATLTIDLVITNGPVPAQPIVWSGAQDGAWDTTTLNWLLGAAATNYNNAGDFVTFDDTAATTTVYLVTATLTPGSVTVNNSAKAYAFTGDGKLSGSTGLTKQGSGTLTLANTGVNDFSGPVSLTGTLQVGAGGTAGNLPPGVGVANNGTLVFNRSDNFTAGNVISGSGAVVQNGPNVLTLNGANSYAGGLTANSGTVRLTSVGAPGAGTTTVNPDATVVLGALHTNTAIVLAGGTLGSTLSLNPLTNALTAADSTSSTIYFADPANLAATDPFEMVWINTLQGSGSILVASVTNDLSADSGNGFRLRGTNASDFTGTIIVSNNVKAELQTAVAGPFSPAGTGKFKLYCGGIFATNNTQGPPIGGYSEFNLRNNSAGDTVLGNDLELLGSGVALLDPLGSAPAGSKLTMGNLKIGGGQELGVYLSAVPDHVVVFPAVMLTGGAVTFSPKTPGFGVASSAGSDLSLGDISETSPASITMNGLRTLFLTGNNNYSGTTVVSNGTLVVNGSNLGTGSVTVYNGTLAGTGAISGPVTIAAGGTLSPGSSIGTLTLASTLTLAGTNVMDLNKSGTVLTNDQVKGITTLTIGGALILNISGDPLAYGDSFKLFAAGSGSGAFSEIVPAIPGPGLLWDVSTLATDGTLRVTAVPQPFITSIVMNGTEVIVSGTNTVSGGSYYVLSTTNVVLPLSSWSYILTQSFNGMSFSFTNAVDPGESQRYYLLQLP